jgi:hypothetical protein
VPPSNIGQVKKRKQRIKNVSVLRCDDWSICAGPVTIWLPLTQIEQWWLTWDVHWQVVNDEKVRTWLRVVALDQLKDCVSEGWLHHRAKKRNKSTSPGSGS